MTTTTIKARKFVFKRMTDTQVRLVGTNCYGKRQVVIEEWSEKSGKFFHVIEFNLDDCRALSVALNEAYKAAKTAPDTSPESWLKKQAEKAEKAKAETPKAITPEQALEALKAAGIDISTLIAAAKPTEPTEPPKKASAKPSKAKPPEVPAEVPSIVQDDLEETVPAEALASILSVISKAVSGGKKA